MVAREATKRLSAGAVHLLSILGGYCAASARTRGEAVAFVSQAKLCERLQRSPAAVKRYVAELRAAGLITVARGYRALNRYTVSPAAAAEMSPSNGSEVSPSNGSEVSPSNGSEVSPSNGSEVSPSDARPISRDLVFTQLHQTAGAAAESARAQNAPAQPAEPAAEPAAARLPWLATEKTALDVLTDAGLAGPVALTYASADRGGLCHLAAAYYAERAAKGHCTLGLLRDMLTKPAEYFREDLAGNWQPPRDSMIYKNMHDAKRAVRKAEDAARVRARAIEQARLDAEAAARGKAQAAADAAAWDALSEGERRGIEQGVNRELPPGMTREATYPTGEVTQFRRTCYRWAGRLAAAQARETLWAGLAPDAQARLAAEARKRFPLWAATDAAALHSICLMLMSEPVPAGGAP